MSKQTIRAEYLALRKAITSEELTQKSADICQETLAYISQVEAKNIHLFLPIAKNHEVDTWPLYHKLLEDESLTPVLSKTHWKEKVLTHHPMTADDSLQESKLGIPEPAHERTFDIAKLDMVLVPLLAFDRDGHRLGYGAGFYDRFLSQCPPSTLKVGLSLLPPLASPLPVEPQDIPLDLCITPEMVYGF